MDEQKIAKKQSRLRRVGKELLSVEKQMREHPLLEAKLNILASAVHQYYWQSLWTSAESGGRLLISLHLALCGSRGTESSAGCFGPSFSRSCDLLETLIESSLKKGEAEMAPLYSNLVRLLAIGWLYSKSELSARLDLIPEEKKKASCFAEELALTFLMRTHLLHGLWTHLGEGLGLNEKSKKIAGEAALFGILLFLILEEQNAVPRARRFAQVSKSLLALFTSVEQVVEQIEGAGIAAAVNLELLKKAVELNDFEAFEEAVEAGFDLAGISRASWQQELVWLQLFAEKLRESLLHIFYQLGVRSTSIMQTV